MTRCFDGDYFTVLTDKKTGYPICGNAGASLVDRPPRDGQTTCYVRCDDSVAQRWLCCVDGVPKAVAFDACQVERFTERHMILLTDLVVEIVPLRRASEQSVAAAEADGKFDHTVTGNSTSTVSGSTPADTPVDSADGNTGT